MIVKMHVIRWIMLSLLPMISSEYLNVTKYNVLILTSPLGSQSHSIYFHAIAKQLALHGHQITFRCIGQLEKVEGIETQVIDVRDYDEMKSKALFNINSVTDILKISIDLTNSMIDAINKTYNDPLIMELMQESLTRVRNKSRYDVILIDYVMAEMYLPLAHRLGVPSILVSTTVPLPTSSYSHDVPYNYFLNFFGLPDPLSIISRTIHFLWHSSINAFTVHYLFGKMAQSTRTLSPTSPLLELLTSNVSFTMTGSPFSIKDCLPTTPSVINLGCVHCQPAEPLPQDLEEVMQRSGEHGVIYFSMGSFVDTRWVPNSFLQKIINALRQLPQTILWKGQLPNESNISNFYIREWFPQQQLLAHRKMRLVIIHGGMLSMQEVTYHGCPILGFPISTDTHYAMKVAKDNGNGEILDWKTFTTADLLHTINNMLTNGSYKEAALKTSVRMKDVLDSPSAQAAYWTEYMVRHKGAPFLKSDGHHLYWYQYFLLDVIALMVTAFVIVFMLTSWAIKRSFKVVEKLVDL